MKIVDDYSSIEFEKIIDLYDSVGWGVYTQNKQKLKLAFKNSTYVLIALDGEEVVGALRSISDDSSIHYLQDILIKPSYQKQGLGRKLIAKALERFKDVKTHMILTDDELKQKKFYESIGYKNTKELRNIPLNTFVRMKDIELS